MNYAEKYFPNGTDNQGNKVWLPGNVDGIPVRAPFVPNLTQDEYDSIEVIRDAETKIFDLSKPEELLAYNDVIDKCAKGLAVIRHELFLPDETAKSWRVMCQWLNLIGELPTKFKSYKAGNVIGA